MLYQKKGKYGVRGKIVCSPRSKQTMDMINELVSSGKLTQSQLDAAQKQAQQMRGMFEGMRGMFGK